MKRRSTIEARSHAVTAPSKTIGGAVIIPCRAPANDTGDRSAAMLELIQRSRGACREAVPLRPTFAAENQQT